jgi:hypothetical protein
MLDEELIAAAKLVDAVGEVKRARWESPRIASLDLHRRVRKLREAHGWSPLEEHTKAIAAALLGSARPRGTT